MSTVTTDDMNEVIAVFDGWEFIPGDPNHKCNFCFAGDEPCTPAVDRFMKNGRMMFHFQLNYHESWNTLIPVIAKIPKLIHAIDELKFRIEARGRWKPIENEMCNFNRTNVHICLYEFITWYNSQKP